MVIKERKTADALDKMIRSDPTLTRIMMNGDSQFAECWVDWFTEENFRKVRYIFQNNSSNQMGSTFHRDHKT